MYTNDELNEIIRNLGKSTVSENYRDSLVSNNLTPRVSYRVSSDQEIPRESSEFKRPFELYTKTNSIFSKNKDKSHFLAVNNVASPRKTLFKRKGSAEIMNSQENPMDLIENQISPLELEFRKLEKGSKSPLNLKFDLKPIQIKDTFEILKGFLLLAIEVERLEAETKTWKYLYNELEGRLQLLVKEKEEIRENFDNSLVFSLHFLKFI